MRTSNQFINACNEHARDDDNWADVCNTIEMVLEPAEIPTCPLIVETYFGSGPQAEVARRLFAVVNGKVVEVNGLPSAGGYTPRPTGKLNTDERDQFDDIANMWSGKEDSLARLPGTRIIKVETDPDPDRGFSERVLRSNSDVQHFELSTVPNSPNA